MRNLFSINFVLRGNQTALFKYPGTLIMKLGGQRDPGTRVAGEMLQALLLLPPPPVAHGNTRGRKEHCVTSRSAGREAASVPAGSISSAPRTASRVKQTCQVFAAQSDRCLLRIPCACTCACEADFSFNSCGTVCFCAVFPRKPSPCPKPDPPTTEGFLLPRWRRLPLLS